MLLFPIALKALLEDQIADYWNQVIHLGNCQGKTEEMVSLYSAELELTMIALSPPSIAHRRNPGYYWKL